MSLDKDHGFAEGQLILRGTNNLYLDDVEIRGLWRIFKKNMRIYYLGILMVRRRW